MTRHLLAFSRRQSLEPRVLDVNKVIQEMAGILAHLAGESIEVVIARSAGRAGNSD